MITPHSCRIVNVDIVNVDHQHHTHVDIVIVDHQHHSCRIVNVDMDVIHDHTTHSSSAFTMMLPFLLTVLPCSS